MFLYKPFIEKMNENKSQKLDEFLSKVQTEAEHEEFIYGVTNRVKRGVAKRIQDFFIDRSKVPAKEKSYFFELLGTMIRAGIPLNRALKILVNKTEHARLRRISSTLSYELEHGYFLSQALSKFPDVFSETERGVVKSAETVGHLENSLFKIADSLNRQNEIIMRLKSALIYPIAVLASLIVGAVIMLIFVAPRMREIFEENAMRLPWPTRVLLFSGEALETKWWLVLIIIIFLALSFHIYTHSEEGHFAWDFKKLRLPFIGSVLKKIYVMRFTDTLGLLTESGLPINTALKFTADAIGNEVYRVKTFDVLGAVQEGRKLSSALGEAPFLFPETVTNMLAVGEHAASLGDISQKIGAHFEKEIDYTLKNMTTVLGPVLILLIGVSVAFFALAVLSPIFSLTQNII
ncbi:type II secretion system F family protein [Candidatus Peregrinibacteria bacterium]|nr:type II secretion system F family protein [Candidatus Peregrinibacteria bacterium]